MSVPKIVVVDVDVGVDDAFALILLLSADQKKLIKIAAITCVNGNTELPNVYCNVKRILKLCGREDIPVYIGAFEPLIVFEDIYLNHFHGRDGLGDLEYESDDITVKDCDYNRTKLPDHIEMTDNNRKRFEENLKRIENLEHKNAIDALNQIVNDHPKQVTLICLGPLTNVALAIKTYRHFAQNLKEVYLMGGNYQAVGNVTCTAEFNFHIDPEAAYILLHSLKCPITVLPWEPCTTSTITMDWRFNKLGTLSHPFLKLLNAAEKRIYTNDRINWIPCDALLVGAFLHPELIKKQNECNISVELHGTRTRAQMVINRTKPLPPNANIITDIDFEEFQSILFNALK